MPGYKREVFENYFLIKIKYKKKTFEITHRVTKHSLPLVWIVYGPVLDSNEGFEVGVAVALLIWLQRSLL